MSKIYQELEQIFKFRILSNDDIAPYMKRMSALGKIDAVKSEAIITLILKRLGELEEADNTILPQSGVAYLMPDLPERREGTFRDPVATHEQVVAEQELECPSCDFVAKSKLGLLSHSRKHQK